MPTLDEWFTQTISIHALRKESDMTMAEIMPYFNISIHALRKESDGRERHRPRWQRYFNPRSP